MGHLTIYGKVKYEFTLFLDPKLMNSKNVKFSWLVRNELTLSIDSIVQYTMM